MEKHICAKCGKECDEVYLTYDCHGIPFRYVCEDCYAEYNEEDYDGEYYTELDENLDYDY